MAEQMSFMKTTWAATTSWMAENVEQVNALVQKDRWITVTDTANKLNNSYGSAYFIIHEDLGYFKICVKWVTK